jgi:hypothetical protein
MKLIRKLISPLLLVAFSQCMGLAQSPLLKMPLDIRIGVTKNAEIQGYGVCVAKIKGADSISRCIKYSMMSDQFFVHLNPNQVVVKISFVAVDHHVLPQNWQNLGLRLASSYRYRKIQSNNETNEKNLENEGGNLQPEFMNIIKANNAKNIQRKVTYTSDYEIGEIISFTIGNLHYDAEFIKWVKPKWCQDCPLYTDYNNGLVSIEVVEAFD